ncbi:hypothetical protein ACN9MF_04175 [Methylobacterium fujisawaense]|uniref:hypothetical protein n=1 Tax=Methylobacterium fujisawaense TaxID=107400 RepID=UPI00313E55DE
MGLFDAAGAAALAGETITAEVLAVFDFRDAPQRVHAGFGTLRAGGRDCRVYLQLYGADLAPLGGLYTLYRGVMDRLTHAAAGPDAWTAQLTAETRFSRRGLPPFGNLTDADQQRRHPGDAGLFDIAQMINRRRPWNPEIPETNS